MFSTWVVLCLIALLLLVLLTWVWLRQRERPSTGRHSSGLDTLAAWEPQATRVLTAPERMALKVLANALPEYLVLAQVPLARFIRVPTRYSYAEWLRRVGQLCPDLLVCDSTSQVIAVVEVRLPANQISERARARAERMRRVLKAAGIPMHVWVENALPSVEAAREAILPRNPSSTTSAPPMAPAAEAPKVAAPVPVPALPPLNLTLDGEPPEPDEIIEMREPPPSTWFDDLDSKPLPLTKEARTPPPGRGPR